MIQEIQMTLTLPINYEASHWSIRKKAREQYVSLQHNLSEPAPEFIKKKKINTNLFPKNFFKYPIHLHHSHYTKMTIGAVHSHCNAVLWIYHGE